MTRKPFDELTIADDFMFCKVMEDESLCKTFLELLLTGKVGKITYLSSQNAVTTHSEAKSIRLDVLVKDETGKSYDVEMQVGNEHNLPKRMRYYQAALDVSFLDQGYSYQTLNDSYIIFVCLFDPIGYNRAVYTFENICIEDKTIPLQDGTKKIILNAGAFNQTGNHDLQGFLRYVKTGELTTDYTKRIESMIQAVKMSEQARQEYRFKSAVIMDAEDRGLERGLAEGEARGSRQAKFETAAAFKRLGIDIAKIAEGTGLSCEEIEKL